MLRSQFTGGVAGLALLLASCGGGGRSTSPAVTPPSSPPPATRVFGDPAAESLSVTDVQRIIAQSVAEAQARSRPAIIAIVDRVGNVLAVFAMNGFETRLSVPLPRGGAAAATGLQGLNLNTIPGRSTPPSGAGAIAKAVTGAYLSSAGNAFSTRTASQIVQEHFPPAPNAVGLESGPLYGVQFSSLPCSDLVARFAPGGGSTFVNPVTGATMTSAGMLGPKRTPLGLSADAGGLPLYKNGTLVGGIGVMADGVYGFDGNILDVDAEDEEFIALAGTVGFDAPVTIQAPRITVDGTTLRYSDATAADFRATGAAPTFASINGVVGGLAPVPGYTAGPIVAGTAYGAEVSGIRQSTPAEYANRDIYVLTNGAGANRFPPRAGTDGAAVAQPLTAAETQALLEEAFRIMSRARAQIRRPLDSPAQVSLSVVDTFGSILGVVRSPDAPIFGTDVSLQKARTAAFFSNARAAAEIAANGNPAVRARIGLARTFFNDPNIFTGQTAWPNRAIGNIARPYFPDGEVARPPGPFSPGIDGFNPFSTGIQSELVVDNIVSHVVFLLQDGNTGDTPARCTTSPDVVPGQNRLQNGIQIFPGSVPVYRGNVLVGAIGISGDGIDQDDMIAFLGTFNAGQRVGNSLGNAPAAMRSDQIVVPLPGSSTVRIRYVSCPFAPFLDTADQNVCQGR